MTENFDYPPTPAVLHSLSAGQLTSRWQRAVRLWWLLRSLYGSATSWQNSLPNGFRYGDVRSRLFAPSHGKAEKATVEDLTASCRGSDCICQRSLYQLLARGNPAFDWDEWCGGMEQSSGLAASVWEAARETAPFAVVHRSIRDDLKALVQQGWLYAPGRGLFSCVPASKWPSLPTPVGGEVVDTTELSTAETWELLSVLEAIAFVQPNLEVLVRRLWEQANQSNSDPPHWEAAPQKRIFIHLDYILPPAMQEQVDTHQATIEPLWRTREGGIVQFEYRLAREERLVTVTVYPVCLHYARRAKYLSAYGRDPNGQMGWHNYRLDRIVSAQLQVLPWGDAAVPEPLRELRAQGELPTPSRVEEAIAEAWGFNFYLPKAWLLMRFPAQFARWYVDQTERHPTFERVPYGELPQWVAQWVPEAEQTEVLQVIRARSPQDAYYAGWVRVGDINVVMRLRDWRPKGEVIAPWVLRQLRAAEARVVVGWYGE
ncbi:MAG: TIGR03985 family CRISPR-associated protein [Leptolyngbyaceae cyanobacterium]